MIYYSIIIIVANYNMILYRIIVLIYLMIQSSIIVVDYKKIYYGIIIIGVNYNMISYRNIIIVVD